MMSPFRKMETTIILSVIVGVLVAGAIAKKLFGDKRYD